MGQNTQKVATFLSSCRMSNSPKAKACEPRLDLLLGPKASMQSPFRALVVDAASRHRQLGEEEESQ
jgi:hypothetical protein